jgi:hypothetical protein
VARSGRCATRTPKTTTSATHTPAPGGAFGLGPWFITLQFGRYRQLEWDCAGVGGLRAMMAEFGVTRQQKGLLAPRA